MAGGVQWDWVAFFHYLFDQQILRGAWTTIWLTALGIASGTVLGSLLMILGTAESRIPRMLYGAYTGIVRGTPLLVQLVLVYNGLPEIGITLGVVESTLIALAFNESAYMAEIIRGGINSVPSGQMEAAKALGMSRLRAMRVVILPQGIRAAIPAAGNEVNGLLKSTSLVSVISMTELFRSTQEIYNANFRVLELLIVATLYYLVMGTGWRFIQNFLEQRLAVSTTVSRVSSRRGRTMAMARGLW